MTRTQEAIMFELIVVVLIPVVAVAFCGVIVGLLAE